jgi:hypothetical protein
VEERVAVWNDPREVIALMSGRPEEGVHGPVQSSSPQ